jgi:hypothetical protein
MPFSATEQEALKVVINRALSIITDNKTLAESWGFYLFDVSLEKEPELRNKITAIYVGGMLDTMDSRIADRLATARFTAQYHSLDNLRAWCDRVSEFRAIVATLLRRYNYEEFVFLQFMRNQLVHGWRGGEHEQRFKVRYFDLTSASTAEKWLEWRERVAIMKPFFGKGIDEALAPLRDRLLDSHNYWRAIGMFQKAGYLTEALRRVYGDIGVEYNENIDRA